MHATRPEWWADPVAWVELFLLSNVAFLGVDIAIAHSANAFARPSEWVPIAFSVAGTFVLLAGMLLGGLRPHVPGTGQPSAADTLARALGLLVGWGCIAVGVVGLVLHLRSDFFANQTLRNLVYTAPFAAPLAYTGVGLVLVLNRTVAARSLDHARWLLLLAMGGFIGNFVLSLADHAQNGFAAPSEWTGVIAAALAVGFLLATIIAPDDRNLRLATWGVLALQGIVGLVGFLLHIAANLDRPGDALLAQGPLQAIPFAPLITRFIYGAPAFAPLLFADLALLAALGLWALQRTLAAERLGSASLASADV